MTRSLGIVAVLALAGSACSASGSDAGSGKSSGGDGGVGGSGATPGNGGTSAGGAGGSGAGDSGAGGAGPGGTGSGGLSGSAGTGSGGAAGNGGEGGAAGSGGSGTGGTGGSGGSGAGGTGGSTGGGGGAGGSGGGDRTTPEGVCARWKADRANLSEGTWSGNVDSCMAGDISADGRENALRLFNLYRWLADLPAVTTDATRNRQAQACALLMRANPGMLSHNPPNTWRCWTQDGADGASSSNISSGPGVAAADGYMIDNGNETTIGHRRWILSNSLGPIGLGSTANGASCMQNLRGTGRAGKPWMAWPPPGIVPLQALGGRRGTIDTTGWTVQSDGINLSSAAVSVTSGGAARAVTVTQLARNYGATYAFRFNPQGWQTTAGQTYSVSVTGIATPINYEVVVVDCP